MKEVGYRITIELAVDRDLYEHPNDWDWTTLLDVKESNILSPPVAVMIPMKAGSLLKLVDRKERAVDDGESNTGPSG